MNDTSLVKLGQYVKSIKGRDMNYIFIVSAIIDDKYVKVVDGDLRKVNNPKVKNIKHLQVIDKVSQVVNEALKNGKKISDLMIKQEVIKLGLKDTK
jgi:ribosomal protein L14E/L6E/L27E